jgi:ABC-type antimicrobial peptide transport system permease subunit
VTTISKLSNVAAAAGGLTLTDRTVTGTVPAFNTGGSGSGGGGGFGGSGGGSTGGSGGGGFTGGGTSSFNTNSFTVTGVDISHGQLGPLSTGTISSGRTFTTADDSKDVALVEASYATSEKLKVGSTIAVGNSKGTATNFTVVGIVSEPSGDSPSDVYLPLGVAQSMANLKNDVNTVYVSATSNNDITTLANTIKSTVPGSTVTDENSLASEVTGSLSSAASLANSLGKWLAIAVLIAAFLLASLLTMSAVSRRIREFGTLKALGWRSRRVVGQVLGESIAIGIVGGVVGVGLGFLGAALVDHFSGSLSASLGSTTGTATPGGAQRFGGFGGAGGGTAGTGGTNPFRGGFASAARTADTVAVHLSAPVTITAIVLAVGLAVLGGLIAGGFGGWRAARLRPAAALSKVA